MLVRTQILLDEKTRLELEETAKLLGISMSEIVRKGVPMAVKKIKSAKKGTKRKETGGEFLLEQAKKAVHGPGDSEYDKYAYDDL